MLYRANKTIAKSTAARQILAIGLLAVMTSACSTDVKRFAYITDEPGSSTASIPKRAMTDAAPIEPVRAEPLSPVADNSYDVPPPVSPKGGARVVVIEQGDTLNGLSRRHNVSVGEIAAANNLKWPYEVQVGQRITVPAAGAPRTAWNKPAGGTTTIRKNTPGAAPRNPVFASRQTSKTGVHVVKSGETIYGISRRYGMKPVDLAGLNNLNSSSVISVGQKLRVSSKVAAVSKPAASKSKSARKTVRTASNVPLPRRRPAYSSTRTAKSTTAKPRKSVQMAKARVRSKPSTRAVTYAPVTRVAASSGAAKFRWPVKGRVISEFGRKTNGTRNDGINFAVPVGASIKSAGHGVVAYAGNELKGYGNLILIRHSDDWVTAYAHNSRLLVKRGQKVRRGEIIAKAGQTGSVDRPQLHFEVRKGAQAVNPKTYMGSSV